MTGPACRDISPNCTLLSSAIKHAKAQSVDPAISRLDSPSKMFSFVSMIYKKKDVYDRGMTIDLIIWNELYKTSSTYLFIYTILLINLDNKGKNKCHVCN